MSKGNKKKLLLHRVKSWLFARAAEGETTWNEDMLAQQFNLSRTPIRDALNELEQEGIIVRRQKKGIVLRKPDRRKITEVYDVRIALEKLAMSLAVEKITAENLQALETLAREYRLALEEQNIARADHLDLRFHTKIIDIADNRYLKTLIENFHLLIQAFQLSSQVVFHPPASEHATHEDLVKALRRKDKRKCLALIEDHITSSKSTLMERLS